MIWTDADGKKHVISRELAKQIDREQGRVHMPNAAVEGVTGLAAAIATLNSNCEQMEPWMRRRGAYTKYKQCIGMMRATLQALMQGALVEQVCSIQANTRDVWVNVDATAPLSSDIIGVSHSKGEEFIRVSGRDLSHLVCAARGGLHDENGEPANCHNCPHWSNKALWQNCELYHLINSVPCYVEEEPQLLEGVCPYAMGRCDECEDEEMSL